jgi:hypothetical protein
MHKRRQSFSYKKVRIPSKTKITFLADSKSAETETKSDSKSAETEVFRIRW